MKFSEVRSCATPAKYQPVNGFLVVERVKPQLDEPIEEQEESSNTTILLPEEMTTSNAEVESDYGIYLVKRAAADCCIPAIDKKTHLLIQNTWVQEIEINGDTLLVVRDKQVTAVFNDIGVK